MSLVFLWRTKSQGLSFRRAIDCLAPVLLEARVDADMSCLSLVSFTDGVSAQFRVPFDAANGDFVQFSADKARAVFCADLKELANWLTQFREGMSLELSLNSGGELSLKFYNDTKSFEHKSALSNLRLPSDVVADDGNVLECDQLADVSSPALCAVARHHHKTNSHARLYVTEGRLAVESCLLEVNPEHRSTTHLSGVVQHSSFVRPAMRARDGKSAGDGQYYSLDMVKKILKASSFQDRKKGRVMLGLSKDGPLVLVFSRGEDGAGGYLKFAIASQSSSGVDVESPPLPLLTLERQESGMPVIDPPAPGSKVIKRKKKKQAGGDGDEHPLVKKQRVDEVQAAVPGA